MPSSVTSRVIGSRDRKRSSSPWMRSRVSTRVTPVRYLKPVRPDTRTSWATPWSWLPRTKKWALSRAQAMQGDGSRP